MKKHIIFLFMLSILLFTSYAVDTSIQNNNIVIDSGVEQFYCEPVYKDNMCLVKVKFDVQNTDLVQKNVYVDFNLSKLPEGSYKTGNYYDLTSKKTTLAKTTSTKTDSLNIKSSATKTFEFEIWASESGKFDIIITDGIVELASLDPIINVSINSTYPSYYLINGTNSVDDIDSYDNYTEISAGLSDDSTTSSYNVRFGQDIYDTHLFFGYTFNAIEGSLVNDFSEEDNDMDLVNNPSLNVSGIELTGLYCDGNNQVGVVDDSPDFDIASDEDFAICLSFNFTEDVATDRTLMRKGISMHYRIWVDAQERVSCTLGRNGASTTTSTSSYNDRLWHTACCYSNSSNGDNILYVDGNEVDRDTGGTGAMSNSDDFTICANSGLTDDYEGYLDEVCGWKISGDLPILDLVSDYNTTYCINETKGKSIHAFFNYSMNLSENPNLKIISNFGDVQQIIIWTYLNETHINTTNYLSTQSTGLTTFVDISPIIYDGYNYPLRISVLNAENKNISDIFLYSITNSTQPIIENCTFSSSNISCTESNLLTCDIATDDGISSAKSLIFAPTTIDGNSTGNVSSKETLINLGGNVWGFNYSASNLQAKLDTVDWNYSIPINFSLLQVNATNILGFKSSENYIENQIYFTYSCLITECVEDWQSDPVVCLINDTYFLTYTDSNSCGTFDDLPVNNGTYQSCNYCSEDLTQVLGTCQSNSSQSVSYTDGNYSTCCAVTGISSDCSVDVLYPYNETTSQACTYFNNTMGNISCQNEPNFNTKEKEYCLSYIPSQYLNETFKCISNVQSLSTWEILQTNPEYRERTTTLIDLGNDPETREYFTPANSIVNFYYTKKNLNPENDYILTIECSSTQRTLRSSMLFQMAYEDFQFIFFRFRWGIANASYIIAGIIVVFVILVILFMLWRSAK